MKIRVDIEISDDVAHEHGWESREQMRDYFKGVINAGKKDLLYDYHNRVLPQWAIKSGLKAETYEKSIRRRLARWKEQQA